MARARRRRARFRAAANRAPAAGAAFAPTRAPPVTGSITSVFFRGIFAPVDVRSTMHEMGRHAREASRAMARADTPTKNRALAAIAAAIRREQAAILAANAEDVAAA